MHILIFNWRDIKNPKSGGAEILTHEIAKRLVKNGERVTQFSAYFENARKKEIIDGVTIIREGHPDLRNFFSSVQFRAFQYYRQKKFGDVDLVIDEIHGVPFFTPLYVKEKTTALICEYAGSLWDKAVQFPFNYFGKITERLYPMLYKKTNIITISESSRREIKKNLFRDQKIKVIHPGCSTPLIASPGKKPRNLTLVFIARISKTKGIEDAVATVESLKRNMPDVVLHIIGRGEKGYVSKLRRDIHRRKLSENIIMHGFVTEKEKIRLIDMSHFLLITSEKEGWGLTVHEANSRGVPAMSYDIPGVRDVILNNENGILVKQKTPKALSSEILTLYAETKLYNLMARRCIVIRRKYSWENTTNEFLSFITK